MSGVTIDKANFTKRLTSLYNSWQTGDLWNSAEALVVPVGASSEELRYHKSIALQVWLYGYELPDTVMLFTKEDLYVLTSSKKAALLQELVTPAQHEANIKLQFLERAKGEDGSAQIQKLIDVLKKQAAQGSVGTLPKDKPEGKLTDMWSSALEKSGLSTIDVGNALADLLSVKDDNEVTNVKKAAFMTASVMKTSTVPRLEGIIDEEKKVKHSKLSEEIEQVLADPQRIQVKLTAANLDIAYAPIVQSGGQYDLKVSAASDDRRLEYDVILCSLGARYSMYCANIARTFLVDPVKQQEEEYKALLQAQEKAINALVEGAPMSAAMAAVVKALQDAKQGHLVEHLPKNIGFGMGLEFREAINLLKPGNERRVAAGMVFNVAVGVSGLEVKIGGKPRSYALLVADTVVVMPGGATPEVLTAACNKAWSDVAYFFKDEEAEPAVAVKAERPGRDHSNVANKKTNLRSEDQTFKVQEEQRRKQKENQEDLLKRVNEETLRVLRHNQDENNQGGSGAGRQISEVVAYRSISDMPSVRDLGIQVDQKKESVLVPIYGVMVPFHILTIKNATNNQDGDHAYIRLNFNFGPGFEPGNRYPNAVFLKELSFRTSDTRHAVRVVQEIKVLRSNVSQREREQAERATLVQQERLVKSKGRMYTLPDVWIRPNFGGKGRKVTGQLEAHSNGFRYSSPKGETLDIMYRNIKHAFYQPAENEMICLVHFHLINPIMVAKKKTQDVQCYAEVMDSVQTLDAGRRSMYDPDEIEEEQREREQRNKINKIFQQFVRRIQQDVWERDFGDLNLEFEIPFRELGFHGVPHKSTAFIMPTVNCLVELVESPATVVAMPAVAIVNLERVGFNLRNFDMVIVFKDLTKDVFRIDAIPSQSLDTVREWLSSMDIKFYENKVNLNWKQVLKSIVDDPEAFEADGGWSFLDMEGDSGEEEEESEEGDPEFQADGDDSEEAGASSEDFSDSDDESLVDSDEAQEEGSEEEDEEEEEEGKDWEELEEEAKRDDRERHVSDDEEENRRSKQKRKGGSGGSRDAKRSRR